MTSYERQSLELLKEISAKLDALIFRPEMPVLPNPNYYVPPERTNNCPKCGINMDGIMGYVCGDMNCPYGGNITC